MALDYFYDEQIRRYLLQFARIFNSFQYRSLDASGNPIYNTVPATLATMDRQVNAILNNNSENTVITTPQISCWISALRKAPERIQDPNYVRVLNFFERQYDETTKQYNSKLGNTYTVESLMPVPYTMIMQTDIWTSNEYQKHQLLEQILILFNPILDLQTSRNPLDWSALSVVELQEITWSSRSYPVGTTDTIDVASLIFKVPVWLNAPSKIKRQNIIQQIIVDIGQMADMNVSNGEGFYWSESDLISRVVVTPEDFHIKVEGNIITLLNYDDVKVDAEGTIIDWTVLLNQYGQFKDGSSQIHLKPVGSDVMSTSNDIVGVLSLNPENDMELFWTLNPSTLPANTLPAIDMIIDPLQTYPGKGLPLPLDGQRYLIVANIPTGVAWGGITASEQDIIQYSSVNGWEVVFSAEASEDSVEYLINSKTGIQWHWTGELWINAIEGEYFEGYWRLFL